MAKIQKTAFEERITNSPFDALANVTGVFLNKDGKPEICPAGFLVKQGENLPCEGYEDHLKNQGSWYMQAAGAGDLVNVPIFACNTHNVSQMMQGDVVRKIGPETLGLEAAEGETVTYTRIFFDGVHTYRFGVGNAAGEVGENKFFTIADGLMVPVAAAPTGNGVPYFKLVDTGSFEEGNRASFGYVDVVACVAMGAASSGTADPDNP